MKYGVLNRFDLKKFDDTSKIALKQYFRVIDLLPERMGLISISKSAIAFFVILEWRLLFSYGERRSLFLGV
jgi:hypothetical protein